jgi:hypothetical protein
MALPLSTFFEVRTFRGRSVTGIERLGTKDEALAAAGLGPTGLR